MSATIPSTGPAFNADTIAQALFDSDGTIALSGRPYSGSGILVAIPEHALSIPVDRAYGIAIRNWVEENVSAIVSHPAPFYNPRYFGSWVNSGILYLDIVEAFPREEFDAAMDAGIARRQVAIYDNGRKELYATGAVE